MAAAVCMANQAATKCENENFPEVATKIESTFHADNVIHSFFIFVKSHFFLFNFFSSSTVFAVFAIFFPLKNLNVH